MKYKKIGEELYLRLDKNDEIMESIQYLCEKENILSGRICGIGACGHAVVSSYRPLLKNFTYHQASGMLELVSLLGNVAKNKNGKPHLHLHALFSYLNDQDQMSVLAGHLKEATISYTSEIVISPAQGLISLRPDTYTEIDVWYFE